MMMIHRRNRDGVSIENRVNRWRQSLPKPTLDPILFMTTTTVVRPGGNAPRNSFSPVAARRGKTARTFDVGRTSGRF